MVCGDIAVRLATRKDLSLREEREVRAHLASCGACTARWQREERISGALRILPSPAAAAIERVALAVDLAPAARRRGRRLPGLRLAYAGLALALLALLFVERGRLVALVQTARSTIGTWEGAAAPTPTLYVSSFLLGAGVGDIRGYRTTALDPATQREKWRVDGGYDAILAPDGSRLYVVVGTAVVSVDTGDGRERWRIPAQNIANYMPGGPSALAASPDGRWLYIASYRDEAQTRRVWLQIVDTSSAKLLARTIALPECLSPRLLTPPRGAFVHIICPGDFRALDTRSQQIAPIPTTLAGGWEVGAASPDGGRLYIVDEQQSRLQIFDTQTRELARQEVADPGYARGSGFSAAVSADGARLVVAHTISEIAGTDNAGVLQVFDTRTWAEVGRLRVEQPITAVSLDTPGRTVFAVIPRYTRDTKVILPDDTIIEWKVGTKESPVQHVRPNEDIQRVFFSPRSFPAAR